MKLLIDTNIFIPLEPTGPNDVSPATILATDLASSAAKTGTELWLHPAQRIDVAQDTNKVRRDARELLFNKYQVLEIPLPPIPLRSTNDWVDDQLVAALKQNAVSALITEDRRLTKKAIALVGPERVLGLVDAIESLRILQDRDVAPPPNVVYSRAYQLDLADPFWDSFRKQYPGFDKWLAKCQAEHRPCWVIRSVDGGQLAGVAIVNHEQKEPKGKKTLKICSFKVDPNQGGRRYGELLLKAVFDYAFQNVFDTLYITVFPEHEVLLAMLKSFGFIEENSALPMGEIALVKFLDAEPTEEATPDPLAYFIERGPYVLDIVGPDAFIVPIWPQFHRMLFPELSEITSLFPDDVPHGNSFRKAYISSANTTQIKAGDILFFYRSQDLSAITAWGVVESVLRSKSADEICDFVLPRTVYSRSQIEERCQHGAVLAIMFRQVMRRIEAPIKLERLISAGVLKAQPQSIVNVGNEAKDWLRIKCLKQS